MPALFGAKKSVLLHKPAAWTPNDMSDSVWWDASDVSTMTNTSDATPSANDSIKTWQAKGSYTGDTLPQFSQTTAGKNPTYRSGGYIDFDGSDVMVAVDRFFANPIASYSQFSVAILLEAAAHPATTYLLAECDANNIDTIQGVARFGATTGKWQPYFKVDGGGTGEGPLTAPTSITALDNTKKFVSAVFDPTTTNTITHYEGDSTTSEAETFNGPAGTYNLADMIAVGATSQNYDTLGGASFYTGYVYQIVVVPRAFTTDEIDLLAAWSATK